MRRVLMRLAAALLGLLAVAIVGLVLYLDAIVARGIERGSSQALGVETTLDSARIGLLTGSFRLSGLDVSNPPGFTRARFLGLERARLEIEASSLRKPAVVIPLLAIEGIEVDLDKRRGKANYDVILANLRRFESADPEPAGTGGAGKRFVIRKVSIRDLVAHVRVVERAELPQVDVVVPEVRLHDLGSAGRPLTSAQVTDVLVKAVLTSIAKAGADLPGGVARSLYGGLGRLARVPVELPQGGRLVRSAAETAEKLGAGDARDAAGDALDAGKDAVEDAGQAVRGLGRKLLD